MGNTAPDKRGTSRITLKTVDIDQPLKLAQRREQRSVLMRIFIRVMWRLHSRWLQLERSIAARARYSEPKMRAVGVLGFFGYPAYYWIWSYIFPESYENLFLRLTFSVLSLPLILVSKWPTRFKSWLPLYWFGTVTFAIPFFFSYMVLRNNASSVWLMTHLIGTFLLLQLFDLLSFLVACLGGCLLAVCFYLLQQQSLTFPPELILYLPIWTFALIGGSLFSITEVMAQQSRIDALVAASSNIAHEVRTPLATLRASTQALRRFLPDLLGAYRAASEAKLPITPVRTTHFHTLESSLTIMEREIRRANIVIDMLLIASRPVGNVPLELVSARACVDEAVQRYPFGSLAETSRVRVEITEDFQFKGVPQLVVHVMFNLIKNGLFHTARAKKGEVSIRLRQSAEGNHIMVRDTGTGIPADILPHIFDRFYTSATDHERGLGIGLAFCRSALEHMDATISCRSRVGSYTEFVLTFPPIS